MSAEDDQQEVAALILPKFSQPRVAAIEKGELPATEVSTIERYVSALGGKLEIVAEFDGERLALS